MWEKCLTLIYVNKTFFRQFALYTVQFLEKNV